jgi:hypothetical protein
MQPTVINAAVATPVRSTEAKKKTWYEAELAAMIQTPGRAARRGKFLTIPPKNGARISNVSAPIERRTNPITADGVLTA